MRLLLLVMLGGCSAAPLLGRPVTPGCLRDGTYEGSYRKWPNSSRVRVTVTYGRIASVEVVKHGASWIGQRARAPIAARIVQQQSTAVDAVSGATNSSRTIMNAAEVALGQARTCR